ncbi:Fic family protein [Candidatus Woesearchaeota archaeon]|nr:Fic family protein [Candidatus Woesearchaeota archaeon]
MVTIRKRTKGNEEFYYLEHSIRKGEVLEKKEKYLGKEIPKNIEEVKKEFFHDIFKERWHKTLDAIKQTFSKEYRAMPKSAQEKYLEHFMIKFTYDTNRIEGSTLNLHDTANLLKDGISPPNKPIRDIKETEAHKRIFYEMLNYKKDISLTEVLYWHKMLFEDSDKEIAGKIRKHQVAIAGADVELPLPVEVPILFDEFFKWYHKEKKKLHPVELAALVHLKFVSIHPFTDGNGRISRLLMNFVLQKNKYPMLNIQYTNRAAYYRALERSQKTKREYIFVQYIIKRYIAAYKKRTMY